MRRERPSSTRCAARAVELLRSFQTLQVGARRYETRVIGLPILWMPPIDVIGFEFVGWGQRAVVGAIVRRQRQHRLRKRGVVIAILFPAVANQDEVAHPSSLWRWRRREGHPQLVAGIHDYIAIVHIVDKLAHIAKSRVVADEIA